MKIRISRKIYHKQYVKIRQLSQKGLNAELAMARLIDSCERSVPSPVWKRFRRIDFRKDCKRVSKWLITQFGKTKPPNAIRAFYFGLCEPGSPFRCNCSVDGYDDYCKVSGYEEFDEASMEFGKIVRGWPIKEDYADSYALARLYDISQKEKSNLDNFSESILCFGYVVFALTQILPSIDPYVVLGKSRWRTVVVGWSFGTQYEVGRIARMGGKLHWKFEGKDYTPRIHD